jgi:PAS domain S-box-containing protein
MSEPGTVVTVAPSDDPVKRDGRPRVAALLAVLLVGAAPGAAVALLALRPLAAGLLVWALFTALLLHLLHMRRSRVRGLRKRELAEQKLQQTNRALRLFSQCNSAVVHATEEHVLLTDLCRIAVESAGYRMAWVGRAEQDAARTVRPVTYAGPGQGFLDRIHVSWADDACGRGTAGTAIRTRRPSIGRDLRHNPDFVVWRAAFEQRDFAAAIAIPLLVSQEVYGVLLIYAAEPDAFDTTEVGLLEELGSNISHGMTALRAHQELAEAMAELRRAHGELEARVAQRTRELTAKNQELTDEIERRRRAERTLQESHAKYGELVENANSIILRMDTGGRVTFFNEFAQRFFGFSDAEILGKSVLGSIVPHMESTGRDLFHMMEDIARNPDAYSKNENENARKNGERVWIAWTNKPILDPAGHLTEVLCIGNDITDLKRTERELVCAKEAAEAADRLKSAFLATMSHELRTPLNSIIGFSGILLRGLAGPLNDEQDKQIKMVQSSARHLLALINDVLDISKIEAGQLEVRAEPFDLPESAKKVSHGLSGETHRPRHLRGSSSQPA